MSFRGNGSPLITRALTMVPPGHILTAATGARIDMASQPDLLGSAQLKFYTGQTPETPGYLQAYWDGAGRSLALFTPFKPGEEGAYLLLNAGEGGGPGSASLTATRLLLAGNTDLQGYLKDHFGYPLAGVHPGSRLAGTGTDSPIVQAGTVVINFVGANGNLVWPTPFPNGVLTVIVSNGDGAAQADVILATRGTNTVSTGINAIDSGGGFITGAIRVNYVAIGY